MSLRGKNGYHIFEPIGKQDKISINIIYLHKRGMDCGSTLFIKCNLCELMKNYLRHNEYFSRSQTNQNAEALERQFLSNSHLCYVVIRMPTSVGALKTKVRAFLLKTMVELKSFQ